MKPAEEELSAEILPQLYAAESSGACRAFLRWQAGLFYSEAVSH